jgi:hypothetical protein
MAFSMVVELLNIRVHRNKKVEPVKLVKHIDGKI